MSSSVLISNAAAGDEQSSVPTVARITVEDFGSWMVRHFDIANSDFVQGLDVLSSYENKVKTLQLTLVGINFRACQDIGSMMFSPFCRPKSPKL